MNWSVSYLITTVLTLHDLVLALKIHQELRLHPRHPIDFDQNSDWIPWKFQMNAWMIFDCSKVSWYWNYLENKWSSRKPTEKQVTFYTFFVSTRSFKIRECRAKIQSFCPSPDIMEHDLHFWYFHDHFLFIGKKIPKFDIKSFEVHILRCRSETSIMSST